MRKKKLASWVLLAALAGQLACRGGGGDSVQTSGGPGPHFKPAAFNLFSPEQDVQLGRQSAEQVMHETPMVKDAQIVNYVQQLTQKLATKAEGERFNFQSWVVATKEINAFALPGGFLFVNAGAIAAAKNEGELAGVMAHEISHATLRHGTAQASKAKLAEGGLGILGVIAGAGERPELGQIISQVGGFGANMLFLKFGRTAEKQADLEGARILAEAGYDPRDMANFFKTLESEGGQRAPELLSDHPDPGNRIKYILEATQQLHVSSSPKHDSPEFQAVKARLTGRAPQPLAENSQLKRVGPKDPTNMEMGQRPPRPSGQLKAQQAKDGSFAVQVPANWDAIEGGASTLIFAPHGGYGKFNESFIVTHGVFVGVLNPQGGDLGRATSALIQQQINDNPDFQIVKQPQPINFGGQQGYVAAIAGPSANTGVAEVDVTYTTVTADGRLFYLITIAPEDEQQVYKAAFEQVLRSLQLAR
ncbi:MAG: M48 family metalloprotease [Acidobacteria bacterium]|nr:M48 family metalloprotease [Acidobacteriota bacterium]MBI3422941.1 M48 family metalloprotease [Acidobacteriota bacterium]